MATDLETGDAVVLDKAISRSRCAPASRRRVLFAPVEDQGRLLVDGGISENLPIDVARAMHADIIIVSDVSFPLQPRKQLDSALAISNQMLAILVRKDTDLQKATLGPQDILIEPAVGLAASTDFTIAAGAIVQGEAAARDAMPRLAALRVGDSEYQAYLSRRAAHESALPTIRFVQVDEPSKRYEETILAELQPLIGKPLDVDALDARIKELYGLGYFETLDYSLVERGEGPAQESGLEIRARRKSWGPTYLRFGLNLQDDFQGNNYYNAHGAIFNERNQQPGRGVIDRRAGRQRSETHQRVLSAARCAAYLVRRTECAGRGPRSADLHEQYPNCRFSRS